MNLVSPFGRLSRRGYLAAAVPVVVVLWSTALVTHQFAPDMGDDISNMAGGPWFRWMLVGGLVVFVAEWSLFCACVKRLHDFGWSGIPALPLLAPWLRVTLIPLIPMAMQHWHLTWDLPHLVDEMARLAAGLTIYSLALEIVLAVVPGTKRRVNPDAA